MAKLTPDAPEALPAFQRYQYAFSAHIRDPRVHPRPRGVPAQRMRVYNELLFNNLEGFLLACFPVSRRILGARRWKRLVRSFFAEHRCRTPFFRQIPEEFVQYLAQRSDPALPPFLPHLAHYEWVELALDVCALEIPAEGIDAHGDLLAGRPMLNPVSRLLSYPWPVQRLSQRFQPQQPNAEPTRILAFRDAQDRVRFIVLNTVSARLLTLLQPGELSGREALERIVAELQHPQVELVVQGGRQTLEHLRAEQAILGTCG